MCEKKLTNYATCAQHLPAVTPLVPTVMPLLSNSDRKILHQRLTVLSCLIKGLINRILIKTTSKHCESPSNEEGRCVLTHSCLSS